MNKAKKGITLLEKQVDKMDKLLEVTKTGIHEKKLKMCCSRNMKYF